MTSASLTERTMARLKADEWDIVEKVEHSFFMPKGRRRIKVTRDLISVIDVLAIRTSSIEGIGTTLGVQSTSWGNTASRVRKIKDEPRVRTWLRVGHKIEVWGWKKLEKAIGRRLWVCKRIGFRLDGGDIESLLLEDPVREHAQL